MTTLPIRLLLVLCFGAPHCLYSRPVWFPTWHACARAGAAMVAHARRVGRGDVGFACRSLGGMVPPPPALLRHKHAP